MVSGQHLVQQAHLLYRLVQGQTVGVNLATNSWLRFNRLGSLVFEVFSIPATEEDAVRSARRLFGPDQVSEAELRSDIHEFVEYLVDQKVLRRDNEPSSTRTQLRLETWRDEMDSAGVELMAPLWAKFEISTRCHLDCSHCYIPFADRAPKGPLRVLRSQEELTDEEILSVIDQLAELGTLLLTFTGGEIFLRKTVLDLLSYAHSRGFVLELFTSGTLLNGEKVSALADMNIGRVQISVYSADSAVHDEFTRLPGSWVRSMNAISLLAKHGIPVEMACSITPFNYQDALKIRDLAESLGATCAFGYPITSRTNGERDTHRYRLSPSELQESIKMLPDFFALPSEKAPESRICPAGVNMCSIGANGDVFSCSSFLMAAGNVREQPLAEIWTSSPVLHRIRSFRTKDLKPSVAGSLSSYVGLCPGMNLLEEGDPLIPSAITAETTVAVQEILSAPQTDPSVRHRLLHPNEGMMRAESA